MDLQRKKVGLWIRVSSDMQVEADSPAVHLKRAQDYAADRGWEVVEIYRLDGVSGGAIWDLPITKKMLYDIKTGRIEGLVFTSLERLGRDTLELLQFEKYFREHEASLISIFDNIDTSTSDGKRYFQGLAAQAEYERAKLSERVKRGILTRHRRGEIFTKEAPYGYRKDKERKMLVPDPVEGPVVQQMFCLYMENRSFSETARKLNASGHRTTKGNLFTNISVRRTLTDATVKGLYYANTTRKVVLGTKKTRKFKPREEWIPIQVEPLISEEAWDQVQVIINGITKPKKWTAHAYSGILKCHDGNSMYFRSKRSRREKPKYFCRACSNKILADDLDQAIGRVIQAFALDRLPEDSQIESSMHTYNKESALAGVNAALQKLARETDKLVELFTADALSLADFKARKAPLDERQAALEQERAALEFEITDRDSQQLAATKIKAALNTVAWGQIQEPQKNELLRTFVKEITLDPETIRLQLLYVPVSILDPTIESGVQR